MNAQSAYGRINWRPMHWAILVSVLFSALGGCAGNFPYNRPFALNQQTAGALEIDAGLQTDPASQNGSVFYTLLKQYRENIDPAGARNAILHRLLLMDDMYFLRYTLTLYNGRAYADATSEIINTSLTLAATAVAPAQAAKVLTGIAAGLSAAKISVDKNIFLQQASPALIAKMEAQRAEVRTEMVRLMQQPVTVYPLEDGLSDFVRYFRAGTLSAAAQSLTASAEQEHVEANQSLQQAKIGRFQAESFTAPRSKIKFTLAPAPLPTGEVPLKPIPDDLKARNKRLEVAFELVTESQARRILMDQKIDIPNGVSARETLAKSILVKAGKPIKQGASAIASLTGYRLSATDDASTKTLEDAYSAFLNLGEIPAPAPTP